VVGFISAMREMNKEKGLYFEIFLIFSFSN